MIIRCFASIAPPHNMKQQDATNEKTKKEKAATAVIPDDVKSNSMSSNPKQQPKQQPPCSLLFLPLFLAAFLLGLVLITHRVYHTVGIPIVDSYRRNPEFVHNFHSDFHNEFTYYNRPCQPRDVSTNSSADLLISADSPDIAATAADTMTRHGAVAVQNVLSKQTAEALRQYVESNHIEYRQAPLRFNQVFWEEGKDRLSLALGVHDDPSVAQALREIGSHKVLGETLKGLLHDDAALVEISTLTCMRGANFQGLHSDSDWFGSSLLYGQSFLHSYSMFIALQDTTQVMGATTVCPGTHFCADPEDLDFMCLREEASYGQGPQTDDLAFSISTNGQTGRDDGLIPAGDAFLFNQNIWHRGPGNRDEKEDRIMMVLTFVTNRNIDTKNDLRRQGLGTYYYQRWNVWGHTYNDLKHAGVSTYVQPLAALRAIGLLPSQGGIPWIHQWAQQMANQNDFFTPDTLQEFKEKVLIKDHYPKVMWSEKAEEWEPFIKESLQQWVQLAGTIYVGALSLTVMLGLAMGNCDTNRWIRRVVLIHVAVAMICTSLLAYVQYCTELGQAVTSGKIAERPFSTLKKGVTAEPFTKAPATVPERNDILLSTRYDADFLASYTKFLNYHPGNKNWKALMDASVASQCLDCQVAAESIVSTLLSTVDRGLPTRFVRQDPVDGIWHVLTYDDAVAETLVQLKENGSCGTVSDNCNEQDMRSSFRRILSQDPMLTVGTVHESQLHNGDAVYAWHDHFGNWFPGQVSNLPTDETLNNPETKLTVHFDVYGGPFEIPRGIIRKQQALVTGDYVSVDYEQDGTTWFEGRIVGAHPNGLYNIQYDDGEYTEGNKRQYIVRLDNKGEAVEGHVEEGFEQKNEEHHDEEATTE